MFSSSVRNMNPISPGETDAAARRYLQAVKRELHCPAVQKALFLRQMEDSVSRYISERLTVSVAELTEEFGTPADIAKSFLEEADPTVIGKSLRHGRKIFWAVLAVAVLLAVIFTSIYLVDFMENQSYRRGHYVETVGETSSATSNLIIVGVD